MRDAARRAASLAATVFLVTAVGGALTFCRKEAFLWPFAGQNLRNTANQALELRIRPDTASRLQVKWVFRTGGDVWTVRPAVDDAAVYVTDAAGDFYKLDRDTGAEIWSRKVSSWTGVAGDSVRATPAIVGGLLVFGDQGGRVLQGAKVMAVDKETGNLRWVTQVDSHPAAFITQSAVAHDGRVYVGVSSDEEALAALLPGYPCCSFRGSVLALDTETGAILWKTPMVPGPEHPGFSGGAVWSSTPVVDVKRHSLYVTTGNNYTAPQAILDCATMGSPDAVRACVDGVPGAAEDHFDSIVALDLETGQVRWADAMLPFDAFTIACIFQGPGSSNCPKPRGPDYDFGQGAMLFEAHGPHGGRRELLGAGQKSGIFWAVDPDDGRIVWHTRVGPGGSLGGLQWGSATDGRRIYTAVANSQHVPWTLPSGRTVTGGFWSALDAATGEILWQTPGSPAVTGTNQGPVTVANGVVFGGTVDTAGTMVALDAETGETLWTFQSGGSVIGGAAVAGGTVYWGSGYGQAGIGLKGNDEMYAFSIPAP